MSRFLEVLEKEIAAHPDRPAFLNSRTGGGSSHRLTYGELDAWSDAVAAYLVDAAPVGKPVVIYGHKSPLMLVCFIAAAKAGLTYAPVDIAYPADRVNDILAQIGHPLVISLADGDFAGDESLASSVMGAAAVRAAIAAGRSVGRECWIDEIGRASCRERV